MPGKKPRFDEGLGRVPLTLALSPQEKAPEPRSGRLQSPLAACATARNRARPLFIVSSHSAAGSES